MAVEQEQAQAFRDCLSLASVFSDCIEILGQIHPANLGLHSEDVLLARLGIQQARLLICADVLGVASPPPTTGITHAVPLHPGAANPDPTQPINFGIRDSRIDKPENRQRIEEALHGISDIMLTPQSSKLLKSYGLHLYRGALKPFQVVPAVDLPRLEAFRERMTLLEDVSSTFPDMPRRKPHFLMQRWQIHSKSDFPNFLDLIRKNIDFIVRLMDLQSKVDKSMRMDIRALGWHPSEDPAGANQTSWKLTIIHEAAGNQYPEYSSAAQEALDNLLGEWKGMEAYVPQHVNPLIEDVSFRPSPFSTPAASPIGIPAEVKKGGFFHRPKFLRKTSGRSGEPTTRRHSVGTQGEPVRSNSEYAKLRTNSTAGIDPPRSQSVHGMTDHEIARTLTHDSGSSPGKLDPLSSTISRHDQYHGMWRIPTKKEM